MRALSRTNIICISCPKGCKVTVESDNGKIKDISGYDCQKGKVYAKEEVKNPRRILPTTVRVKNATLPLLPVKTSAAIPKELILEAMQEIAQIEVEAPVNIGDVIIKDFMNTGVDLIATRMIE